MTVDLGSALIKTTKAHQWRSRDVYTHTTYGNEAGRTVITRHFRRDWTLHTTTFDHFSDSRQCPFCGETWTVARLVQR